MRKPDAVLIGYRKSGTTFLRNFFTSHPQISWAREGEFFITCKDTENTEAINQYLSKFENLPESEVLIDMNENLTLSNVLGKDKQQYWPDKDRYIPNKSLNYNNIYIDVEGVAQKIKSVLPDAKVMLVIRNQVDWLLSSYLYDMLLLPSRERNFQSYLSTITGKMKLYTGQYDQLISSYFNVFGRENVKVIVFEELVKETSAIFRSIESFLNIDPCDDSDLVSRKDKQTVNRGIGGISGKILEVAGAMGVSDEFISGSRVIWQPFKDKFLSNSGNKHVLKPSEMKMIHSFYSASNVRTSVLLDKDLSQFGYGI